MLLIQRYRPMRHRRSTGNTAVPSRTKSDEERTFKANLHHWYPVDWAAALPIASTIGQSYFASP